jgi:hypothetical protein
VNALAEVVALVLLGAVFYMLGVCGILAAGLILHALFFDHPEDLMLWAIILWSLACIVGALRLAGGILRRG